MLPREVEDGGENNIRNNDQKRGLDYGGRGGPTDSIGPAVDPEPLQATHVDDDGRECQALDQSANYVAQLNRTQHVVKVKAETEVGGEKHEDSARQDAANVRGDGETRNHDQRGQVLWR